MTDAALHAELIATLRLALLALNTARRFRVGETDSYKIAARIEAILARLDRHALPL